MSKPLFTVKKCLQCGTEFRARQAVLLHGHGVYCSLSCAARYKHAHNPHLKPNTKPTSTSYKPGEHLGKDHPRWKEPLTFVCINCSNQFTRKPWVTRQAANKMLFCSAPCRGQYRGTHLAGPNAPDWVGGAKTYRGRGWLAARKVVVDDQGGCCARCGKAVGSSLAVHHIRAFREFASADEANARANLIGLCQSCHMRSEQHPSFPLTPKAAPIK